MSKKQVNKLKILPEWISQKAAALLRKVTPSAISRLLRRGRLRSKIIAGRRLVSHEDVLNFQPLVQGSSPSKHMTKVATARVDREEWITYKEAATLRQMTLHVIRTAINRGRLRALKIGGVPFVYKKDVINYQPRIDYHPGDTAKAPLPPGDDPRDWISVAEAARMRNVGKPTIIMHAIQKRIRSIKWGDTRLIYRPDILNFKPRPRPGRPKKKNEFLNFKSRA